MNGVNCLILKNLSLKLYIMNKHIINIKGYNKLLSGIYITNLPDSLNYISLILNGCGYLNVKREDIEECYKNKTNLLEHWGFYSELPINSFLVINCNNEEYNVDDYCLKFIDDDLNVWKQIDQEGGKKFYFYDKRIENYNYLLFKNYSCGIAYLP